MRDDRERLRDILEVDEMLEDYSEHLTPSHLRKAVRGKYAKALAANSESRVKITGKNRDKYVNMKTVEVEAFVNNEGQLTVKGFSNLPPGNYQAVLIIEEPIKPS
ncbi:hypothetical protein PCC8801_0625 [Rippkaea orientalis PCC 8801]|uniref:Uncharacterized protein n=1 Tax=Rippkaea orientalis (strain PCC 8801 / RF-1) TaxID=41431 RepID=B7JXF6_RIPO1|nr:hypothetical protein [Rippkaea orientalis]ACK64713.1 hypothetical protein PCC8801_0625 [Rippkaea orientalis PCC 8801]